MSSEAASLEVDKTPQAPLPVPEPADLEVTSPGIMEWISKRRADMRPWSDFFKTSHFEVPRSPGRLGKRVLKNLEHFQSNYVVVFVVLFVYCLLTSPLLIVAVAAYGATCGILRAKQRQRKLMLANHEVTLAQQCSAVGLLFSVPVFLLTGAGSAAFWVLGATCFCVILHASLYNWEVYGGNYSEGEPLLTGHITDTEEV